MDDTDHRIRIKVVHHFEMYSLCKSPICQVQNRMQNATRTYKTKHRQKKKEKRKRLVNLWWWSSGPHTNDARWHRLNARTTIKGRPTFQIYLMPTQGLNMDTTPTGPRHACGEVNILPAFHHFMPAGCGSVGNFHTVDPACHDRVS